MKILVSLSLMYFISCSLITTNCNHWILKITQCDELAVPTYLELNGHKVGEIKKVVSMSNSNCIAHAQFYKNFKLTTAMSFSYRKYLVGNSVIIISIDSSFRYNHKNLARRDTIFIN
jgi:hypothetical protein